MTQFKRCEVCSKPCSKAKGELPIGEGTLLRREANETLHPQCQKTPSLVQIIQRQSKYVENLLDSHKQILKKLSLLAQLFRQETFSEVSASLTPMSCINPTFELGVLISLPLVVLTGKPYLLSLEVKALTAGSQVLTEAITFAVVDEASLLIGPELHQGGSGESQRRETSKVKITGHKTRGISLITYKKLRVFGAGVEVSLVVMPMNATYIRPLQLPRIRVVRSS
jgi:hypothetical protein